MKKILLSSIIVIIIFSNTIQISRAATSDELLSQLGLVYTELNRAEIAGGNITPIVDELNQCVTLIKLGGEANLQKANNIITQIHNQLPQIEAEGAQESIYLYQKTGITLVLLTFTGLIIWVYGSKIYWALWYIAKRNWIVES
jgi:hypothetical protein